LGVGREQVGRREHPDAGGQERDAGAGRLRDVDELAAAREPQRIEADTRLVARKRAEPGPAEAQQRGQREDGEQRDQFTAGGAKSQGGFSDASAG
jgi:hypothetical protein